MGKEDPLTELQSLQEELNVLEEGQAAEKEALEKKFLERSQPLYDQRRKLVRGEVEPTVEEAGLEETDQENGVEAVAGSKDKKAKGIPVFWLTVLKNQDTTAEYVKQRDEEALEYLEDVRCLQPKGGGIGYRVEFQFAANPYFHDKLLIKEIQLPFVGAPLSSASLTEMPPIRWKGTDNNLTVRIVSKSSKKQKGSKGKGKDKEASPASMKAKPCQSFFNFFSEAGGPNRRKRKTKAGKDDQDEDDVDVEQVPLTSEDFELELDEGVGKVPEDHLELLMAIWHEVVPNAVELYVSGGFAGYEKDVDDSDPYALVPPSQGGLENLPPGIRRRVRALQHLHGKQKVFKRDRDQGLCKLREDLEAASFGIFVRRKAHIVGKAQDSGNPTDMAISRFWLLALKGCPATVELIRRRDEKLLGYLADIRYRRRTEGPGFHIDFEFLKQCKVYMENRVLTKTYIMSNEGGDLLKTESTPVMWQEDMDVTIKTVETGKGTKKNRPCPSFFQLFDQKRTALLFSGDDTVQLSAAELRDREAELALVFRDTVVPRAVELFEAARVWDNEDEEEEDDDESDVDVDTNEDSPAVIKRKLKGKGTGRDKGDDDVLCCGLSRGTVFILLLLLVASSQVFLYLDYILMQFGY